MDLDRRQVTILIDRYCAVWNQENPTERLAQLAPLWAASASYTDPNVHAPDAAALVTHIQNVRSRRPGATVVRTSEVALHHRHARFAFAVRSPDGTAILTGEDIFELTPDGHRIAGIVGFFGDLEPRNPAPNA